jgi:hypothetical protein
MVLKETVVSEEFIAEMKDLVESNKRGGLIEACSRSLGLFAKYMLGFELRAWQVRFLKDVEDSIHGELSERKFLALTSRQIGKTTAISILALWVTIFNKLPGGVFNSSQVGVISISDDQAKKVVREIKKLLKLGDKTMGSYKNEDGSLKFGKSFFSSLLSETKGDPNNMTTITFTDYVESVHGEFLLKDSKQGSFIKSFPPTAIILGNTYSLILIDEAGKSEKMTDQVFYDYIVPTADEMDAIMVFTSTPWVLSGFFYRYSNPNDDYEDVEGLRKYLFTIDAIKVELPDRYARIKKQTDEMILDGKKDEVDRGYYCKFVKGEQSYFDPKKVFQVFTSDYFELSEFKGECDMGVDFGGQTKSKTVITISTLSESGEIRRLFRKTYEVQKDLTLIEDMEELMTRFNVQRVIPDDCAAGTHMILRMVDKGWNVHPMNFKSEKVKKYGAFRAAINRGEVKSFSDDDLKTEMLALEFNHGQRNSYIQAAAGYNDDLIDSFVLSAYFFVQDENSFKYWDLAEVEEDELYD